MIMEQRKEKEIKHYDAGSREWLQREASFGEYKPLVLSSYQLCYKLITRYARQKRVLDYGCGNGVHIPYLARIANVVTGIDLSELSLEIARRRIEQDPNKGKITLQVMDCENVTLADQSFDVVFDGGTFSSLDFDSAMKELARILTPEGCVIGIETFGHNPLTNLKRKLNRKTGARTAWATGHILTQASLVRARHYFKKIDVYYFHIISWIALPFLAKPGGILLLRILEMIDRVLLLLPFFRKYAFKIVFVFSNPLKTVN